MKTETELQARLRQAKQALDYCVDRENEARRSLASLEASRRAAKEKYHDLYLAQELAEMAKLKADYRHSTA